MKLILQTMVLCLVSLASENTFAQSSGPTYGPNGEIQGAAGTMSGPAAKKDGAQLSAEEIEAAVCQKRGNYCTISYCAENPVLKKGCEPTWTAKKGVVEGLGADTMEPGLGPLVGGEVPKSSEPTKPTKPGDKLPASGETVVAKTTPDKSGGAGTDKKPADEKPQEFCRHIGMRAVSPAPPPAACRKRP